MLNNHRTFLDKLTDKVNNALSVQADTDDVVSLLNQLNKNIQLLVSLSQPSWTTAQERIMFGEFNSIVGSSQEFLVTARKQFDIQLVYIHIASTNAFDGEIFVGWGNSPFTDKCLFSVQKEVGVIDRTFYFPDNFKTPRDFGIICSNATNGSIYVTTVGYYVSQYNQEGLILNA